MSDADWSAADAVPSLAEIREGLDREFRKKVPEATVTPAMAVMFDAAAGIIHERLRSLAETIDRARVR